MSEILNLEPKAVWQAFHELNQVPRPSKREDQIQAWAVAFGESLNLPTEKDHVGNVKITKPGTAGLENAATLVIQAHLDMVPQKNEGTDHDFDKDPIEMYIDNGWVKARGTTLGSDNGIGVAFGMALFRSTDIAHPPLELLLTADEETGMTGALGLKEGWVTGKYLLNIDTEDETDLTIGCAGGVDVTCERDVAMEDLPSGHEVFRLSLRGLTGGHSGCDIHLGLGNANALLTRILLSTRGVRMASFDGGNLRNVIPREASAVIAIASDDLSRAKAEIQSEFNAIAAEYRRTDADMTLSWDEATASQVLTASDQSAVLRAVHSIPVGIQRMSPEVQGLVQTSNNLSAVKVGEGRAQILCLTRSSSDTEKQYCADRISTVAQLAGFDTELAGAYPGWEPAADSALTTMMKDVYVKTFNREPHVNAIHAGLECGIIGEACPGMKMISFGPDIRGAHSPDERVDIGSVERVWQYFLNIIEAAPSLPVI